jgi:hypothetical protein
MPEMLFETPGDESHAVWFEVEQGTGGSEHPEEHA